MNKNREHFRDGRHLVPRRRTFGEAGALSSGVGAEILSHRMGVVRLEDTQSCRVLLVHKDLTIKTERNKITHLYLPTREVLVNLPQAWRVNEQLLHEY